MNSGAPAPRHTRELDEHDDRDQVDAEVEQRRSASTDSGITMRGKWILRTRFSRSRTARTDVPVTSAKNW